MRVIAANTCTQPQARSMGAGRELFGRRKDGTEVPIEVGLNPTQTEDGLFVLVSVVDVSERRRVEQAAARQRNEVAHLSRVGMLGALSGSLAHELNQPLTAILSNAQAAQRFLAQTPPRLDQVAEIIDDIVKNDRRAATVIQRLRALLKKEDAEHRPGRRERDRAGFSAAPAQRSLEPARRGDRRLRSGLAPDLGRPRAAFAGDAQFRDERLRGDGRREWAAPALCAHAPRAVG